MTPAHCILYIVILPIILIQPTSAQTGPGGISSDLTIWLKAGEGVVGSPITAWNDQSGNGNNATRVGSADIPSVANDIHNFNPSIYFSNGDNGYFTININDIVGSNYNLIAVVERDNSNADNYFIGKTGPSSGSSNRLHFGYRDNTTASLAQFGDDVDVEFLNEFDEPAQSVALLRGQMDASNGKTIYELRDGTATSNTDGTKTTLLSENGTGRIGHDHTASRGFEGYISEVIVYNATRSNSELTQIYTYLAIKYGFTLESGRNYIGSDGTSILWNATTYATYHHDIAGVGRDDNSGLSQTRSMSESPDAMVIIDKGGSFTFDLDYLLWGNDDGAISLAVADKHPDYDSRLERVWRVAINEDPGPVTVRMVFPGNNGTAGSYGLHVDDNGVFASGSTNYIASSIEGDTITFTNVSLPHGHYFTLGESSTPLPVEWLDFRATYDEHGQSVQLNWSTASETNNEAFTVERSANARTWSPISEVPGAGNSDEQLDYETIDTQPVYGQSYYRIKQTDYDGTHTFSKTLSVTVKGHDTRLKFYPNPASNRMTIEGGIHDLNDVSIYNVAGQLISGKVTIEAQGDFWMTVNISRLPAGIYTLRLGGDCRKLIKTD